MPGAQRGDFLAQGAQALRALFGRKGDLPKDGGYGLRVVFRRYGEPINPENRFLLIEAPCSFKANNTWFSAETARKAWPVT